RGQGPPAIATVSFACLHREGLTGPHPDLAAARAHVDLVGAGRQPQLRRLALAVDHLADADAPELAAHARHGLLELRPLLRVALALRDLPRELVIGRQRIDPAPLRLEDAPLVIEQAVPPVLARAAAAEEPLGAAEELLGAVHVARGEGLDAVEEGLLAGGQRHL